VTIPIAQTPFVCPQCRTQVAASLLSCPSCHRLVHKEYLTELAARAQQAESAGDLTTAMSAWREALGLLPRQSQQFQTITAKVDSLGREIDKNPPMAKVARAQQKKDEKNALAKGAAGLGTIGLLLWKFKFLLALALTKGKLLLLGLTNLTTLFSMFLSIGVYWAAWGWRFALGLVVSIYIHEMGHVAELRRRGFPASAPMFIPGLGALIRLQQHTSSPHEDARIGLAGPIWGLGSAVAAAGIWLATGAPIWAAIAHIAAWINLFNLIPVWQLDGGRGWRPLSRRQAWLVVAVIAAAWFITHEGMLTLILIFAALRTMVAKEESPEGDAIATMQWIALLACLTALTQLPDMTPDL
jgi:Zn-dependent protease